MKEFFKILGVFAASGAVTGVGQLLQNRITNQPGAAPITGKNVGLAAALGGTAAALAYMAQSPIKPQSQIAAPTPQQ